MKNDRVLVTRSAEVSDLRVTLILSLGLSVIIRRRKDAQGVIVGAVPTMVRDRITIGIYVYHQTRFGTDHLACVLSR